MYQDDNAVAVWQQELIDWGPRVLFAILILIATHFIAKMVQWAIAKGVDKVPLLKRDRDVDGKSVGKELGRLGYWLVWLVGLIAALQPLGLSGVLTPVESLTNEVFIFLPKLLGAGVFFFAGLILARVVRHLVEAALGAINLEHLASRAGLAVGEAPMAVDREGEAREGAAPERSSIAKAVGMTFSAIIIIFAAIGALDILDIAAISDPATEMLNIIARAIPAVIQALVLLAIAYIIAKWAKAFLETILPSLGFDRAIQSIGVMPPSSEPSKIIGAIAFIAVMITALMQAAAWLGGDRVSAMLFQITELGGKVIFGTVIIVVGLFLARILSGIVGDSTGEGNFAQTIVKYAIVALFTAIGLTFMGLANEIVILAFGLILGSAAVATALAFGLGGRDAAARMLEEWRDGGSMPTPPRREPPKQLRQPDPGDEEGPSTLV